MKIRAVIFDVYHTLLEVGPPPADADVRWDRLCEETLHTPASASLADFGAACAAVIAREHPAARLAGIAFPEIYWPAVTAEALPALAQLSPAVRDEFLFRHAQLIRTIHLAFGAAETLRFLHEAGIPLGIASNAQPYTLRELDAAGLSHAIFTPTLCFWSFEHGFSKPDPHVFRLLTARLHALAISGAETLMVGDRLDNDIAPARAQGWQTWHLHADAAAGTGGDWARLRHWLKSRR